MILFGIGTLTTLGRCSDEGNMSVLLDQLGGGVIWYEAVPEEEDKVEERSELHCTVIFSVLFVITGLG